MNSPTPDPELPVLGDPAAKPVRRRFTAEYRARMIAEYEAAPHGEKSAVLRREGLYQSQLREWGMARDANRASPGRRRTRARSGGPVLSAEAGDRALQRANDKLTRENTRLAAQVTQTQAALEIMGKLQSLLESISESTGIPPTPRTP
jgi:transposase-like protein